MTGVEWTGLAVIVFAAAAAYDWANAHYVAAAAARMPAQAAVWSAVVAGFGLVGLLGILRVSPWLAAPEVAGFAVGTYFGVGKKCS